MSFLSLGCDPELMLASSDGTVKMACGLIGGSKHAPLKVDFGNLQEDNVMAEFGIDPATTLEEWNVYIQAVMDQLAQRVSPLQLKILSSADFPREDLMGNEQAMIFGCDPDFNAWKGGAMNSAPAPTTTLRTAGGHIHVGYSDPTDEKNLNLVRIMDVLLGVPSIVLDGDIRRRNMYGKAGAFRPKPYGVEYRTLSNFWLRTSNLREWVWNSSVRSVQILEDAELLDRCKRLATSFSVNVIINHNHVQMAKKCMDRIEKELW